MPGSLGLLLERASSDARPFVRWFARLVKTVACAVAQLRDLPDLRTCADSKACLREGRFARLVVEVLGF